LLSTFIEGEAREVGIVLAGLAKGLLRDEGDITRPACLILGGETTVTLRGNGHGGRNQEMALSAAIAMDGWPNTLIVCFGTDGNDGPTDAAGAFADGNTITNARRLGLDAVKYLSRNDSYNFFKPLDDLIITGPTNTNVNDLMLVLAW
jgi:hydroxypyruvate reductase